MFTVLFDGSYMWNTLKLRQYYTAYVSKVDITLGTLWVWPKNRPGRMGEVIRRVQCRVKRMTPCYKHTPDEDRLTKLLM